MRTSKGLREMNAFCGVISVVLALSAIVSGQINVTETGLNSGESVYGLDVTGGADPYLNGVPISLTALGETNPALYIDTGFYAYGLYGDVNMVNTGAIDVTAVGGNMSNNSSANGNVRIYGLYDLAGDVNNTGTITVDLTGATAEGPYANAETYAYGLYSDTTDTFRTVNNSGDIAVDIPRWDCQCQCGC